MDERHPADDALSELLGQPGVSVADEARVFGLVVDRARRRTQRRRLARVSTVVVVIVVATVGAVAISHARSASKVQVQPAGRLSAADVTFAVFGRPPTSADRIPAPFDNFDIDPKLGSRLAITTRAGRLFVYAVHGACRGQLPEQSGGRTCPPAHPQQGEMYCTAIVRATGSGAGCTTADGLARVGASIGIDANTKGDEITYGLVPDFVTRVTFDGRNIPIENNMFVVEGAPATGRLVFTTPAGDKTLVLTPAITR